MPARRSDVAGFYRKGAEDRWRILRERGSLEEADMAALRNTGAVTFEQVDRMIENAVGTVPLPLGVALPFQVNGKEYLVPMVTEEPSVVARACEGARLSLASGGFSASSSGPVMIGQVQLVGVPDPAGARLAVLQHREEILAAANRHHPSLTKAGGGAKDVEPRVVDTSRGPMLVVHLLVDCRDAMGANVVSSMAEAVGPQLAEWTGGRAYLRVVSNLAVERLARARAVFAADDLGSDEVEGGEVAERIVAATALAEADPYRCATHNKETMDGVDAVVVATGNDWRALEAGAHAYATLRTAGPAPLTRWERDAEGDLVGTIELPMPVGLIGGVTAVHPTAKACVRLLRVRSARELGEVIASVGLATSLAALRASVSPRPGRT